MIKHRVAITGIGLTTPLGLTTESTWSALLAGQSGIAAIKQFDASHFPTKIASEVKNFSIGERIKNSKWLKCSIPFVNFALASAIEAIEDAGIAPTETTAPRWGCVVGSGMMTSEYDYWDRLNQRFNQTGELDFNAMGRGNGLDFFSPIDLARSQVNGGVGLLCQHFNIRGYVNAVHTACASGGQALGLALQVLRRGDADVILAGGYDSMINPFGLSAFCLLGALSTYNDTPETASRPFDLTRNGFVLGEGAAFLVLEKWEHALARGANIYAELAGEGNTLSSYRITDSPPDGSGAAEAIAAALQDGGVCAHEVDYINAHGTSTKMNDLSETNAIKRVFAERAKVIPTSSTKSQTGHLIAAAGNLEVALSALAIHHSVIPMTSHLTEADPDCDLDYVKEGCRSQSIGVAVSNSFGFGGSNSCILLKNKDYSSSI